MESSWVEIFAIGHDGGISPAGRAPGAHGGSMYICRILSEKYGCGFDPFGVYRAHELAQRFGTPEMSERDAIVLGFTFDGVWVRREHISRLADALASFWREHSSYRTLLGETVPAEPTLRRVVKILHKAAADDRLRGVCFNQTSHAPAAWYRHDEQGRRGEAFNLNRDEAVGGGVVPWELFERLEARTRTAGPEEPGNAPGPDVDHR